MSNKLIKQSINLPTSIKEVLEFPAPYFGGKSAIADKVWQALDDCGHYIEPFFGSGAVLLARPNYNPCEDTESVCDKDGFLANVWRSLQFAPDEIARWCDWPVNHADLSARKKTLIKNEKYLLENLIKDEKWCDPLMAGYWIWAASCWIGSGLTSIGQRPHISQAGMGVHKIGKIPHIGNAGKGVHKIGQRPHISQAGMGVQEPYNTNLYTWFRQLSERIRYVRVVCGDWTRVCGGNWQTNLGTCGMFFDPPYGVEDRDTKIYHHDSISVAKDVNAWVLEHGANDKFRIVLAGYYEEHLNLLDHGWKVEKWKAQGGYASIGKGETRGSKNREREALFFSPYCINNHQKGLFDD